MRYFIVLAAFLAISSCDCQKPDLLEYFRSAPEHKIKEFRWVAERINAGDWGKDVDTVAVNLKTVLELIYEASLKGADSIKKLDSFQIGTYAKDRLLWLALVVEDLLGFSYEPPNTVRCKSLRVGTFIGLVDADFGGLKKFLRVLEQPPKGLLFEYLHKHALKYLKDCLVVVPQDFKNRLIDLPDDIEHKLDTLVSVNEEFSDAEKEVRLLARAETLNFVKGKFDAKKMLFAVRHLIDSELQKKWSKKPGRLLAVFVSRTCRELRSALLQLETYNLARVVVPEAISNSGVSLKFRKFNEYSRLCVPYGNYDSELAADANIEKNMRR